MHEIAVALDRGVLAMPVLFDGARMPRRAELPDEIRALADRQAATVDQAHFDADVLKIVFELRNVLDP